VEVENILEQLVKGEISVKQAGKKLKLGYVSEVSGFARFDENRQARSGVPEVILAEGKTPAQVVSISKAAGHTVVVSRCAGKHVSALKKEFPKAGVNIDARAVVITKKKGPAKAGVVGVISAGTADVPVAEEAAVVAEAMGCKVVKAYDVGVAGIHRLMGPLKKMIEEDAGALVVVAGREGTLPSVVAGLVDIPVVAVPTSTGYGYGGKGEAALKSMLQSCTFLSVVNIDNGVGAGACAGLVARRAAKK